jgi:fumarate reductase subunit D
MARSHKPVVWGLFAAGGTVAAFVLPVILLLAGLGTALGLLPADFLSYDGARTMLRHALTRLALFGVLTLVLWHAAHRMRITAHDLGLRADLAVASVLYGIAALGSLLLAAALVSL